MLKNIVINAVIATVLVVSSAAQNIAMAACTPIRIMPLGDSITEGGSSGVADPAYWISYREALYDSLIASGRSVNFVGGANGGWQVPGFDSNHEGHGGWTSAQVAVNVYQWLANNPADYVLLHIGTNEASVDVSNVVTILDEIDRYESDFGVAIKVIVAQIILAEGVPAIPQYNVNLGNLITSRIGLGDDLVLVNMENALVYPDDLITGLHPTPLGYQKIAGAWQSVLEPLLPVCTTPDSVSPSVPAGLFGGAVDNTKIHLGWNASTDLDGTDWVGYRVYRDGVQVGTTSLLSLDDTGLAASTTYAYTVAAYDAAGNVSAQSAAVNIATLDRLEIRVNAGGGVYLDANGNIWQADFGFNNVGIVETSPVPIAGTVEDTLIQSSRWDMSGGAELGYRFVVPDGQYSVTLYFAETYSGGFAAGFRVFDVMVEGALALAGVDPYAAVGPDAVLSLTVPATVLDGELAIDFIHQVDNPEVRAIEVIQLGGLAPDVDAPSIPTGLAGTPQSANGVVLSWNSSTDSGGSGLSGYRVYRDGAQIATTSVASYADTGLSALTTYNYTVAAFDNAGNTSLQTLAVGVTTLAPDLAAPSVPAGLAGTPQGASQVNLAWNASIDTGGSGLAGYRVYRDGVEVTTTSTTSYSDTGLSALTLYNYTVEAFDNAGNVSPLTTALGVTTAAVDPFSLRVNVGGGDYVDLAGNTWLADFGFNNIGNVEITSAPIGGTLEDALIQSSRWDLLGDPELAYRFVVPDGQYSVTLYFAETYSGGFSAGFRVFDVMIEGALALAGVDPYAAVGGDAVLSLTVPVTVLDGELAIDFIHQVDNPEVRAIEVIRLGGLAPDVEAPSIPTGLAGTPLGASVVSLSWNSSTDSGGSGLSGYRVYRDGVEVGTTGVTSFSDTGLSGLTTYNYTVEAFDNVGNTSLPTQAVGVTTQAPDLTAPNVPAGLAAIAQGASLVDLSWGAATDTGGSGLAGYRVYRDGIALVTTSATSYSDTGLSALTLYSYTIEAFDNAGNTSSLSAAVGVTTAAVDPFSLRVNVGGADYVDLAGNTWLADFGFNVGNVELTTAPIAGTLEDALIQSSRWDMSGGAELGYRFVVPDGQYSVTLYFAETYSGGFAAGFRVFDVMIEGALALAAVDPYAAVGGDAVLSLTVPVTVIDGELAIDFIHLVDNPEVRAIEVVRLGGLTPDIEAPSIPTGLAGTPLGANGVVLSWGGSTDSGGSGLSGYRVYRDGIEVGTTGVTSYTDSGLSALTTYNYTVEAFDNAGNTSLQTLAVGVTTLAPDLVAPSVPAGLAVAGTPQGASQVDLIWSNSTDTGGSGLSGYRVYRDGVEVGTTSVTSYSDTGLSASTLYSYTVAAFDNAGNTSLQSAAVGVTTAAVDPFSLRVNVGGGDYVDQAGNTWLADFGYNNNGNAEFTTAPIAGTLDDTLIQSSRWDLQGGPELLYRFAVPDGQYSVTLYFAETYSGGFAAGFRVFDVLIEGALALAGVDPYAAVGGDAVLSLSVPVTVADGELAIDFIHQVDNPEVRAIEMVRVGGL